MHDGIQKNSLVHENLTTCRVLKLVSASVNVNGRDRVLNPGPLSRRPDKYTTTPRSDTDYEDFFMLKLQNLELPRNLFAIALPDLEYKAKTKYTTLSIRFKIHMKIHWNSTLLTMWYTLFLLCSPVVFKFFQDFFHMSNSFDGISLNTLRI